MLSFCLAVVFVLITVIMNVFSICPESECGCNEHCVNGRIIWCSNNNDGDCSFKKGCFTVDTLLESGESKEFHCNKCRCSKTISSASVTLPSCTKIAWCLPKGFRLGVHYPDTTENNPNCAKQ